MTNLYSHHNLSVTEAFVAIASLNIDVLVDFYQKILSQQPSKLIPGSYVEFKVQGLKIAIFKPSSTHLSEFQNSNIQHANKSKISLCLEVNNLEDAIAHIKVLGYPSSEEVITASHGKEIYAFDPDGNRIILHQSIS